MNINRSNILAYNIEKVMLFNRTSSALTNLGAVRKDTLKIDTEVFKEELMDGTASQVGVELTGGCDLLQTSSAELSAYDGMIGYGAHLWLVSRKVTSIIRKTDVVIGHDGKMSTKAANAAKLILKVTGEKVTDVLWQMKGLFDPSNMILLLNPALQKTVSSTSLLDCSNFDRTGVWSGMSSSAWNSDGISLAFDGVNDYISFADSQFRGVEMIGSSDANNRTFGSGIGNWTKGNANDTLASTSGGYSGNGGKLTIGASAGTTLATLTDDITALVVGVSYHLELYVKYQTAWNGGAITVSIGGCSKAIVPTTSYQFLTFDFIPSTTTPTIVITSKNGATTGDILWIDEVSLTTASAANLNGGERIYLGTHRNFRSGSIGNWTASGNHTVALSAADAGIEGTGDHALKITSSGAGSQSTNYVHLPVTYFKSMVAGTKYTFSCWIKLGDNAVNVIAGFGSSGQTKTFTGLSTSAWTKCVWNFTAGANDVGIGIKFWTNVSSPTNGLWIDDITLTEAFDATIISWVKRNGNPSADEKVVSKFNSTDPGYWMGIKNADDNVKAVVRDDNAAVTVNGSTTAITDNGWHMIVAVIARSGNLTVYCDAGVNEGSASLATLGRVNSVNALVVGADATPTGYLNGSVGIVDVKVGEAWTQDQVIEFYNSVKGVYGL